MTKITVLSQLPKYFERFHPSSFFIKPFIWQNKKKNFTNRDNKIIKKKIMKLARQSLKLRTFRTLAKPVSRVSSITNVPSGDGGCGGDCDCGAGRIMKNGYFCSQKRMMGSSSFLGAKDDITGQIPDEADHATGVRREEYDDAVLGRERFNSSALYVDAAGSVGNPTLVPSMEPSRVVGHMCDRFGANLITWCNVNAGEKTECPDCGHVFLLDADLAGQPLANFE